MQDTLIRPARQVRLNESTPAPRTSWTLNELERDGALLRKLAILLDRGDWYAYPRVGSDGVGGVDGGPAIVTLQALRAAIDASVASPGMGSRS